MSTPNHFKNKSKTRQKVIDTKLQDIMRTLQVTLACYPCFMISIHAIFLLKNIYIIHDTTKVQSNVSDYIIYKQIF